MKKFNIIHKNNILQPACFAFCVSVKCSSPAAPASTVLVPGSGSGLHLDSASSLLSTLQILSNLHAEDDDSA
jgi:hypothetical protein